MLYFVRSCLPINIREHATPDAHDAEVVLKLLKTLDEEEAISVIKIPRDQIYTRKAGDASNVKDTRIIHFDDIKNDSTSITNRLAGAIFCYIDNNEKIVRDGNWIGVVYTAEREYDKKEEDVEKFIRYWAIFFKKLDHELRESARTRLKTE